MGEKEVKEDKIVNEVSADIDLIFESILFSGHVEKEFNVSKGFKVKLKPLETGEILTAEAIDIANVYNMPMDIIQRARKVSILSYATVSINGSLSKKDDLTEDQNRNRRKVIHKKYLELPPTIIDKMFDFYIEVVNAQGDLYKDVDTLGDKSENF